MLCAYDTLCSLQTLLGGATFTTDIMVVVLSLGLRSLVGESLVNGIELRGAASESGSYSEYRCRYLFEALLQPD